MADQTIKVLIVDDEEIVRNGIKNILDWEALGCVIAGEASNGNEALEKIRTLAPAVVLLDINMPEMTGIDLLAEVSGNPEKYPSHPQFLILSGYSDFDYAQKALNYGARGYIVKPVDEDVLEEKVKAIVKDIQKESEVATLRNQAEVEKLGQRFVQMFVFGAVEDAFEEDEAPDSLYQVALISPELCGYVGQLQALQISVDENFSFIDHISFSMDPYYIILFKNDGGNAVLRHMERFCTNIRKNKHGAMAALGDSGRGLQGALNSFKQAEKIYKQLFFYQSKPFISQRDIDSDPEALERMKKKTPENREDFEKDITTLVNYIEIYELQKINEILTKGLKWLRTSALSEDEIKKICMAFIVEVQNGLHAKHPEKEFETVSALDLVTLIYTQSYFDEIADMVHDFILGLAESFTSNTANSTVLKVVQYVKNNYNTDMKLEMLGNLFNCNSAYLGKKFREYTGVPFNTYMDIIRIEEAKKLLKSSKYKIYEISKMVGYSNTDYFYLKFKKHTNMTPKEYKASAGEEEK
jgi:two-component system response regulator YesN